MSDWIIGRADRILVTGANGFIGTRVVENLLNKGFSRIIAFVRPSSNLTALQRVTGSAEDDSVEVIKGNLQSREDCRRAVDRVSLILHLAAGRGEKSYPDAFCNSVLTTRNLLDAADGRSLRRFVNVSSFTVYSNEHMRAGALLDESCAVETAPERSGEAYCYAKVRQEELVREYAERLGFPYVNVRPGVVYGPGNAGIPGRVGIGTFGVFVHLGGGNRIPLCYVENCAEAIVLAGLVGGVDGETFNVVDDDLPTSRQFLALYKRHVRDFKSIYVPRPMSRLFCSLWERYSTWSEGQLPPVFNTQKWARYWKGNTYSNAKIKRLLGWNPRVGVEDGCRRYFEYQRRVTTA